MYFPDGKNRSKEKIREEGFITDYLLPVIEKEESQDSTPSIWPMDKLTKFAKNVDLNLLKHLISSVKIEYLKDFARFKAVFGDQKISCISFSPQLGYVLGFDNSNVVNNEVAKFECDLRGGFASFAVYLENGITENVMIGNTTSGLLRVVFVGDTKPGHYEEKIYDSPIYSRVLQKEVKEISVELRTMDNGRLVPFSYGSVLLVLIFKKIIPF